MNEKLQQAFSEQINKEYYSAFLYLAMSNWLNENGYGGLANWNYVQYQEELAHAQNLFHYMQYRDVATKFFTIAEPDSAWQSPLDVFEHILAHEKTVTESINNLSSLALSTSDHAAYIFLQWYVSEQVEEENSANDVISRLKIAGDNGAALLEMDTTLGARAFNAPVVPGIPAN